MIERRLNRCICSRPGCGVRAVSRCPSTRLFSATIIAQHSDSVCIIQADAVLPVRVISAAACKERCVRSFVSVPSARSLSFEVLASAPVAALAPAFRKLFDVANLHYRLCRFSTAWCRQGFVRRTRFVQAASESTQSISSETTYMVPTAGTICWSSHAILTLRQSACVAHLKSKLYEASRLLCLT